MESQSNINIIVLIKDKNLKRMDWRLGKIGKLLCSEKGEVRSAEIIIIKNGRKLKLQRAVNKLYPFECSTGKDKMKLKFVKDNDTKMIKL